MAELSNFIAGLPKAELHMHLEGALEPSLVRTIAQRNNLPVPASCKERTSGYDFHDLSSFLAIYYPNMAVLLHAEDFAELAYSYLTKAHSQNVIHCELFFDPQAHTSRGVPFRTVIEGYTTGIEKQRRSMESVLGSSCASQGHEHRIGDDDFGGGPTVQASHRWHWPRL